ncbi:MAG TPA: hypothetical protein VIV40_10110 [Kofleriaceae bacterium]
MSSTCEQVAERVALGEPLGDAGEHAATCERCKRLVALPVEIGASRRDADPGLGFSARMTAGAQNRIVVRRRRRIAAGLAAAVAVTTLGVFAFTHERGTDNKLATTPPQQPQPATKTDHENDPWDTSNNPDEDADEDVRALVQLANTDRSSKLSADWGRINAPLAPYRALLRGVSHE